MGEGIDVVVLTAGSDWEEQVMADDVTHLAPILNPSPAPKILPDSSLSLDYMFCSDPIQTKWWVDSHLDFRAR